MDLDVPPGLTTLLQDFTVAVLRERPQLVEGDLVRFARQYFVKLDERKLSVSPGSKKNSDRKSGGGVNFSGAVPPDDDDVAAEPPRGRITRRQSVSAERYDPAEDSDGDDPKIVHPKTDVQRKRLSEAVKGILIFRSLDMEQINEVIDAMFEKQVKPDEAVIIQGDDGDNFYVIDSGKYEIYVDIDGHPKHMGGYDKKGSFGELALMYNMPRAATIKAITNGVLWAMDRTTFRRIVLKNAFNKRKMYEALIEGVPMLKSLEPYERMNIADALVSRTFDKGEAIIKQGEAADCMYFVEDGEVVITMQQPGSNEEVEISRCIKGQYFGELALVTHKPRAATVKSTGKAKCAVLDVHAFERLLGPCMDIMKRNINEYEEQLIQAFGDKHSISQLR